MIKRMHMSSKIFKFVSKSQKMLSAVTYGDKM
jgi:hypothetical protein